MNQSNPFDLTGKTALITGAGKGIGRAIALAFADMGADVVVSARTQADIDSVAKGCQEKGVNAEAIACNTKSERQIEHLVEKTVDIFGGLDILVNNAGGAMPNEALNLSLEQFENDFHFNVGTPMKLTQLCAPLLKASNGSVINITSQAGVLAQAGFSSYGTAKAALTHLTKQHAQDFAPDFRVNAISPGTIYTDSLAMFLDEESTAKMIELTPMKSLGSTRGYCGCGCIFCL